MIEKLFSYQHNDISYNYFRDCRTTLLYGKLMTEPHTIMFGTAFCTKEDTYNIAIGCKLALHRFCKNLKLSREARTELQCVLEDHLYHYEKKMIQEYITSYIEEHEKKNKKR